MHVAVVMGTLMLGSWVLNSPDSEEEAGIPEDVQLEQQEQGVVPPSPTSSTAPRSPYNTMSPRPGQPTDRGAGGASEVPPMRGMPSSAGQSPSPTRMMQMFMPSSPTDASTGVFGQPIAPTSNAISTDATRLTPMAPTQSPGNGFRSKVPSMLSQYRGARTQGNAGSASSPASQKAFGDYRPTSGVSPYMNLFRVGGETIDNYTSLVRPQLDQRFLNQKFNRDIHSLERTSSMQRVDMNQLYRANQTLQGVATPQFHMQYGDYSQGAAQ